ncbi:MFS transporter [Bradyrhizobium sp. WSM1253]|uniref:MFS transporter n=1 Tax=Bradyrhizobium sp. WSM1253 TaxID=319003 RepID=UPI00025D21E7|nr:MFS transporter [Bradyrhizobium sp. WSM1253]EIG59689.1 cyanate permease [Bradyrhizobium sp. WSM1253]
MRSGTFYGWRVVAAAFGLAVLGLGFGFYGPPIFLSAIREAHGWPLALVSTAVTVHFLAGSIVTANLPTLYRRFGIPAVTKAGALSLAVGVFGWAIAATPWQLFGATVLSGAGWVTMGVAAVNAIVSPWFVRRRPAALAVAYNGANVGGIIFSPLWAAAIAKLGFAVAAAAIGLILVVVVWLLASTVLSRAPEQTGSMPDGAAPAEETVSAKCARPLPGSPLWRDRKFLTLAAGMSLGLFAQIGLTAHLFSLLLPALGAQWTGPVVGLIGVMAIAGRTLLGWLMPESIDRRLVACASYAVQIAGTITFIAAAGTNIPLLILGVVLFGLGFGNGTFLPPLIAQLEFAPDDVPRVVALIVAMSQGAYSFAPAVFGLIREWLPAGTGATPGFYVAAALVQGLAICAFWAGRQSRLRADAA